VEELSEEQLAEALNLQSGQDLLLQFYGSRRVTRAPQHARAAERA
jgi:hypothetical protein